MMLFTKASLIVYMKRGAGKIGAARRTGLFCVFSFLALLSSRGGDRWNTDFAQNFVTSQD